jgi:hypothetical protein
MRVEVDLYNCSRSQYQFKLAKSVSGWLAPLTGRDPLSAVVAAEGGVVAAHINRKGYRDLVPCRPKNLGLQGERLLPGMTGYMKLELGAFRNAYLLPSSAVFTKGGKSYLLVVQADVTKMVPVKVQVNDGRLAKVAIQSRGPNGKETLQELTGAELVVASRQQEIGEGQRVRTTLKEW